VKILECKISQPEAYIIPIGDLHFGDKGFTKESEKKFEGYLDWVEERENARIFLNGDLLNTATRNSKTSPFDQKEDLQDQISWVVARLERVKDKIIGAISGNHEQRVEDFCGYNPMQAVCLQLDIPYCGYTAIVDFKVGWREDKQRNKIQYTGVFHHTTGGGSTVGSKINRVEAMRKICHNADFYAGSHNHMLGAVPVLAPEYNSYAKTMSNRVQMLVDCGGYLSWDNSYAEAKALEPMKLGSPRIRLDGVNKDIHVSV
jgi:hypothetical protein